MASEDLPSHVSTGKLPDPQRVQRLVDDAHERFRSVKDGAKSAAYPALEEVESDLFGICVAGADGRLYAAGDCDVGFPIMSVAKPFTFALVCEALGPDAARAKLGVNATGLPFNSVEAIERHAGLTNPMVNAGAIAATGLVMGDSADERWDTLISGLSRFAGRTLAIDDEMYRSVSATNYRNRAIAQLMDSFGTVYGDPFETLDLYARQSSLMVTARDLAVMGATLADGGVNPVTRERVVDAALCRYVLVVMVTAGLYETSGDWLYDVGLPGKSGIGGGIVSVSPGKGGIGVFSPRLDDAGNSVRGHLVATFLSQALGLDLFASEEVRR
jgi:glutaminase